MLLVLHQAINQHVRLLGCTFRSCCKGKGVDSQTVAPQKDLTLRKPLETRGKKGLPTLMVGFSLVVAPDVNFFLDLRKQRLPS